MNKNIDHGKKQVLTTYRKIAIASWRHPRDPNTYTDLDLPVDAALAFLEAASGDQPITLTHFVSKIIAHCLGKYPELNHVLRMGNLYERKQVDVFISTLLKSKKGIDLSGFILRDVDRKSLREVAQLSRSGVEALRQNTDPAHLQVQKMVNPMPSLLMRPLLWLQDLLQFQFNLAFPGLGMAKDQFGSVMITNVGSLGIGNAYIPLSPYTRCPLFISIGKPRMIAGVVDGKVVPVNSVVISFTMDHRYADGAHVAYLIRRFKKLFTDPAAFEAVFTTKK